MLIESVRLFVSQVRLSHGLVNPDSGDVRSDDAASFSLDELSSVLRTMRRGSRSLRGRMIAQSLDRSIARSLDSNR